MVAFEISEYRSRVDGVREQMSGAGVDALLVTNEGNICYLTGYEGFSDYVSQAVLVTLDAGPYIILRAQDVRCAEATTWLPQDQMIGYDESYVGTADKHPWTAIGNFVKSKVGPSARIAAEFTSQSGSELGYLDHQVLLNTLGDRQILNGSGLVQKCKRVKSERELTYISEAAAISEYAMLKGIDRIAVGARQSDVAAALTSALTSGTETIPGGAHPLISPWMYVSPIGGVANAPHLKWTDDVYQAGQQTNIEISGFRHRYAAPMARTVYLGTAPSRLKEISQGVIEAWHASLEAMRPGATCAEIARVAGTVLDSYGIEKKSRNGYSIGIDWMDGGASLATNDDTLLVPNMTFHLLFGIFKQDEGYNFSESVRVTESGAVSLASNLPRILFEVPA